MRELKGKRWEGGYKFSEFGVRGTGREFSFSRPGREGEEVEFVPSNLATAWTPYGEESLIGGVLQGMKQFDPRGASMLCRKRMWELAADVASLLDVSAVSQALSLGSYEQFKSSDLLEGRRQVKEEVKETTLKGWVRNSGDDEFSLK
jgi:tRNA-specific adenosine deaminase 1